MIRTLALLSCLLLGGCCTAKEYWNGDTSNCVPVMVLGL